MNDCTAIKKPHLHNKVLSIIIMILSKHLLHIGAQNVSEIEFNSNPNVFLQGGVPHYNCFEYISSKNWE